MRTIVTATPAPKAECPPSNKDIKFIAPTKDPSENKTNYKESILDFLNKSGDIQDIYKQLSGNNSNNILVQDVTNDGIPELIVVWDAGGDGGYIIGCNPNDSKYELLYQAHQFNPDYYGLVGVKDLNRDGIPEIILIDSFHGSAIFIASWKGNKFEDVILDEEYDTPGWAGALYLSDIQLIDLDKNGTIELLWKGGVGLPWSEYDRLKSPYREEIHIFSWNGEYFISKPTRYASPIYRFQAVQDADQETLLSEYMLAFAAYQDAIFSDRLDSWSDERSEQLGARLEVWIGTPTPTAFPEDKTEYPRLAAYAYYRMVVLHTYLGEMGAAKIKYATLQEKFPASNPGHPYVEMAIDFWNAYQSRGKMYDACAAAIAYADAHPEILTPLGSDYHGAQSHTYVPADVCPFR